MAGPDEKLSAADDPYQVLGLADSATDEQIKQSYLARVRQHPPEKDPGGFKRVRAAYECLRTPEKRLETDMRRIQPWPEPALGAIGSQGDNPKEEDFTMRVRARDVISAARTFSDLGRRNFREDFKDLKK